MKDDGQPKEGSKLLLSRESVYGHGQQVQAMPEAAAWVLIVLAVDPGDSLLSANRAFTVHKR